MLLNYPTPSVLLSVLIIKQRVQVSYVHEP